MLLNIFIVTVSYRDFIKKNNFTFIENQ
jgi:hypothetical protein